MSNTTFNAIVSSTTPKFDAKCPPFFDTISNIYFLISCANISFSFKFNFFTSCDEFIFSNIYIKKLERKILPMIDAGCHAAETADFSAAHSAGESIYQLLMDSEPTLKLLFSHRDILEIQLYAAAIADLGEDGERDEYIENFSAIKRWFSFFTETNDLSLEGIF